MGNITVIELVLLIISGAARDSGKRGFIKFIKEEYNIDNLPYFTINPSSQLEFCYDSAAQIFNLCENDSEYESKIKMILNGKDPEGKGVRGISGADAYRRPNYLNSNIHHIFEIVKMSNSKHLKDIENNKPFGVRICEV